MRVRPDHLPFLLVVIVLAGLLWQFGPVGGLFPPANPPVSGGEAVGVTDDLIRVNEPLRPLPASPSPDSGRVELGRQLFHDPRLSGDGKISCASCHPLDQGGMDGKRRSPGVDGVLTEVNTPSVLAAALNDRQHWDGRYSTLEDQADAAVTHPLQMGADWPQVLDRLNADPALRRAFRQHFTDGLNKPNILQALVDFERSLPRPSRFDRWLRGEHTAISSDEFNGYELFKKHGCASCHQGVNIGGNLFQRLGVMTKYFGDEHPPGKADLGRMRVTDNEEDRHVFRVPGLRNVARTAPYFHDASSDRLEDAVERMGRYQLGIAMSATDIALIVAFLKSLDSETP